MSLIESYTKKYKEAQKERLDYLEQVSNVGIELTTMDLQNNRNRFSELSKYTEELEKNEKELESEGKKICEYSTINAEEADEILCSVIKDHTGLDYKYDSIKYNDSTIHFLRRIENDDELISYGDLLVNEDVILLSDKSVGTSNYTFKLYFETVFNDLFFVTTMLTTNGSNEAVKILVNFVQNYIDIKEKNPDLTWEQFYAAYIGDLTHGYDEELLDYVNSEDAYKEKDREEQRRMKRRKADYYHKKRREAINQIQAQRKLELLPDKYL